MKQLFPMYDTIAFRLLQIDVYLNLKSYTINLPQKNMDALLTSYQITEPSAKCRLGSVL